MKWTIDMFSFTFLLFLIYVFDICDLLLNCLQIAVSRLVGCFRQLSFVLTLTIKSLQTYLSPFFTVLPPFLSFNFWFSNFFKPIQNHHPTQKNIYYYHRNQEACPISRLLSSAASKPHGCPTDNNVSIPQLLNQP